MAVPMVEDTGYTKERIQVEYEWTPPLCLKCHVFGHSIKQCPKCVIEPTKATTNAQEDGFTSVQNRKKKGKAKENSNARQYEGLKLNKPKSTFVYRQKQPAKATNKDKINIIKLKNHFDALHDQEDLIKECDMGESRRQNGSTGIHVDPEPNSLDSDSKVEEVYAESITNVVKSKGQALPLVMVLMFSIATWNIQGLNHALNKQRFSKLLMKTILTSNASLYAKGCRIILGWNVDVVDMMAISQSSQAMHVKLLHKDTKQIIFCSFIYATYLPIKRRHLWSDLGHHKYVVRGLPWVLMGDFNVVLNMEDCYFGSSCFNSAMLDFKDCVSNIEVMDINSSDGHYMYQVVSKLKLLKKPIRKLLHDHGNLLDTVVNKLREEEAIYVQAFNDAKLDEERFLKQKAKIEWLEVGDSNSAYFHKRVKSQNQRCRIDVIMNENNVEFTGANVSNAFVTHYEMFLGTSMDCDDINIEGLFQKKVSDASFIDMVRPVFDVEIRGVMFDIGDDRAPGPDGYTSAFFKKSWDIVGVDVCNAVRDFFSNGKILKEINHTFITLIPKGPPRCAFKVDIQKAYDTVDWRFLGFILKCYGFHPTMIKWIMACVTSTSFSISLNGDIHGFFKGKRGLRQGELPVKYLGVPLISSRLLNRDCKVLVEKAKNRIGDWKNKSLSFARRLQLFKRAWEAFRSRGNEDKLKQWDVGIKTDLNLFRCPLCDIQSDSHANLFFECNFSKQVWMYIQHLADMDVVLPTLTHITLHLQSLAKKRTTKSILGRLLLAASSYYVWLERNNKLFKKA
ncbi:MACPF domain-containing protein CAD1 [Tanacetum coccineum]